MRSINFRAASLAAVLLLGGPTIALAQNTGTNTTGGTSGGVTATPPANGTQGPGTGHVGPGPAGASTPSGSTNAASNDSGSDWGGGWWGLLGLIGLAGLAGGRRRTTTTVDEAVPTSVGASGASRRL